MKQGKNSVCSSLILKNIGIGGYNFLALIGKGCDLCLIRYDELMGFDEFEVTKEKRQLFRLGRGTLETLGRFTSDIELDFEIIKIKFHVVRENVLRSGIISNNNVEIGYVKMYRE